MRKVVASTIRFGSGKPKAWSHNVRVMEIAAGLEFYGSRDLAEAFRARKIAETAEARAAWIKSDPLSPAERGLWREYLPYSTEEYQRDSTPPEIRDLIESVGFALREGVFDKVEIWYRTDTRTGVMTCSMAVGIIEKVPEQANLLGGVVHKPRYYNLGLWGQEGAVPTLSELQEWAIREAKKKYQFWQNPQVLPFIALLLVGMMTYASMTGFAAVRFWYRGDILIAALFTLIGIAGLSMFGFLFGFLVLSKKRELQNRVKEIGSIPTSDPAPAS